MSTDVLIVLVLALIFFGGGFYLAYRVRQQPQDQTGNDSLKETNDGSTDEEGDGSAAPSSADSETVDTQNFRAGGRQGHTSSDRKRRRGKRR